MTRGLRLWANAAYSQMSDPAHAYMNLSQLIKNWCWVGLTSWLGEYDRAKLIMDRSGHMATWYHCSHIPFLLGPRGKPSPAFQMKCLLQMAWSCSKSLSIALWFLLGLAINFTWCLFQTQKPLIPQDLPGCAAKWQDVCITSWTWDRALSRPHWKLATFHVPW